MLFADVEDVGDGGDVAVHRIDALEGDQLGHFGAVHREQLVEVLGVIVAPHLVGRAGVADAFDHRCVVERVREHDAARDFRRQRAETRPVRDVARSEQQRCFLAVEIGEFGFQLHMVVVGARDVAGAARACAAFVEAGVHRFEHRGVLAHAEIVVRAPHGHCLLLVSDEAGGVGEAAAVALDVGKHPVAAIGAHHIELTGKKGFEIHRASLCRHVLGFQSCLIRTAAFRCG